MVFVALMFHICPGDLQRAGTSEQYCCLFCLAFYDVAEA